MRFFVKKPRIPLEKRIAYAFKNRKLLERALTHRSRIHEDEAEDIRVSNERLEYLGDAVLELLIAEHLFTEFPDRNEGELTEFRRMLVNRRTLTLKAKEIGLPDAIRVSVAEEDTGGREKDSILSDAYEALLGAIYLDGGLKSARGFIENIHLSDRDVQLNSERHVNYKGALLEKLQARGKHPVYRTISENGPDHNKEFEVAVFLSGNEIGRGRGTSKKDAERAAAKDALIKSE